MARRCHQPQHPDEPTGPFSPVLNLEGEREGKKRKEKEKHHTCSSDARLQRSREFIFSAFHHARLMFVQLQKPFELTTGFLSEKGMFRVLRRSTCWREEEGGGVRFLAPWREKGDERMTNTFISTGRWRRGFFFEARWTRCRRAALSETVASGGGVGGWEGGDVVYFTSPLKLILLLSHPKKRCHR